MLKMRLLFRIKMGSWLETKVRFDHHVPHVLTAQLHPAAHKARYDTWETCTSGRMQLNWRSLGYGRHDASHEKTPPAHLCAARAETLTIYI